ncbi:MAG: DNA mismatch repair endonuclease MutL [Thermaceae bacterium]
MIQYLPEEIQREIAAGEVVFSVADAVRELLENSLDAGASRVRVELWEGGLSRILVRDNGWGIPKEELPLAVERYTSSKLERLDRIQTLGFRGEGLYALRQAGRLRLSSRPKAQLGAATVEAFLDEVRFYTHPGPPGTEAELKDLFLHLPARRRALSPKEEVRKSLQLLSRYLLHRPHLALSVYVEGKPQILFPGGLASPQGYFAAAKAVWGPVVANRLLKVEHREGPYALEGVVSRPELARPRRDKLFLAVNGRPVEWPETLLKAVLSAYRELLPKNSFPVGVLNLTLPPEEVLVHTAPEKSRLRLLKDLSPFFEEAIRRALKAFPLAKALPERSLGLVPWEGGSRVLHLKPIGQFLDTYLLAEGDGMLFIVDQHAAHERVLYEELLRRLRAEPPFELPSPSVVHLTPEEEALFAEKEEAVSALGFGLEPFGRGRYLLRRVPSPLASLPRPALEEAFKSVLKGEETGVLKEVAARMACLPAIKAGHPLAQASAEALLEALLSCETPWVCPHGRPTVLVLSEEELVRRFGRRSLRMMEVGIRGNPSSPASSQCLG